MFRSSLLLLCLPPIATVVFVCLHTCTPPLAIKAQDGRQRKTATLSVPVCRKAAFAILFRYLDIPRLSIHRWGLRIARLLAILYCPTKIFLSL